jgi:release factor glutamine methyltransferase
VDPRVLIPRPDTETLVEAALEIINRPGGRGAETSVVDICTGSGCIPLTLAWEVPGLKSAAADISPAAACVFALNRRLLRRPETAFYLSDLLNGVPGRWDLITANPPYLSPAEIEEKRRREGGPWGSAAAADWEEPELALNGGEGGLKILRRVIAQSPARLNPGGWLVMEGAPGQMNFLRKAMAEEGFLGVECVPDLAGRERVIRGYYGK